jgi:lipopolysaccharide transport system ATP-binding protein
VLQPDEGRVLTRGRIGSLLTINGGAMPRLTGRENAMLLGVLAGLRKRTVRASLEEIKERSGLAEAFERPVGTYSQGMRARLGFAVIQQADPDILLLDEIHEAIDGDYRRHVEDFADALRARGGIVVSAGHDHLELRRLCDHAIRLDRTGVQHVDDWGVLEERAPLGDPTALSARR